MAFNTPEDCGNRNICTTEYHNVQNNSQYTTWICCKKQEENRRKYTTDVLEKAGVEAHESHEGDRVLSDTKHV